jgi:hypothetical protein
MVVGPMSNRDSDATLFERAAFVYRQHPTAADEYTFGEILERLHEREWDVAGPDISTPPHDREGER